MVEHILSASAILLVVCALCQWVAWRVKLPAIIFLLLFAVDEREHIHVFSADEVVEPGAGWSVVSLVPQAD